MLSKGFNHNLISTPDRVFLLCYTRLMIRAVKRSMILFVYLVLLVIFCVWIFWVFLYQAPTCTDGKQNQAETGVDCGGTCGACTQDFAPHPLAVEETIAIPYTDASVDAIATLVNSNEKAALKTVKYTLVLSDQSGTELSRQSGKTSLLPKEKKTIMALGFAVKPATVAKVTLLMEGEEWIAFDDYIDAPAISIVNQRFVLLAGSAGYAEAFGLVRNKSPYDLRRATINVILRDSDGKPLAVNRTTMNTLGVNEERDFRLVWPRAFSGTVAQADMSLDIDMFSDDAFTKQYFPEGRYQSLQPGE